MNQGSFLKLFQINGLAKKLKSVKAVINRNSDLLWHFLCSLVGSRFVSLLLSEKVKFRDALENCLILLKHIVCSIFTAKEHR